MTDKLSERMRRSAIYRASTDADVEEWADEVEGLEEIQKASIEFYCGVIDKAAWRIAVRNSPKGQELMVLAAATDAFA